MDKPIGKVTHYFDKIGVAVLDLAGKIVVGDNVNILGHTGIKFSQTINSMQVDHKSVESATKGDEVAIKVDMPVKSGDAVTKV